MALIEIPGEKLLIKLWETIAEKGIGSLLKPRQIRKEGMAALDVRRAEILMLAQAEIDVANLRKQQATPTELITSPQLQITLQKPLEVVPNATDLPHIEKIAERNLKAEAIRKEIALAKAIIHAEDELKADPSSVSEATVSDDWLLRWRDYAAGVSADELQSIWGKVLAGEIKAPGRYSLRTLEFLKNLNQDDAKFIEKIAPIVINDRVFQTEKSQEILSSLGFTFDYFLQLQDIGLISGFSPTGLMTTYKSSNPNNFQYSLLTKNKVIYVTDKNPTKNLDLTCYFFLTTLGIQVMQLITCAPEMTIINSVAESIKVMGYDKVQVGDYKLDSLPNQILMFNLKDI